MWGKERESPSSLISAGREYTVFKKSGTSGGSEVKIVRTSRNFQREEIHQRWYPRKDASKREKRGRLPWRLESQFGAGEYLAGEKKRKGKKRALDWGVKERGPQN